MNPLIKRVINGLKVDSNFLGSFIRNFRVIDRKILGLIAIKIISAKTSTNGETTIAIIDCGCRFAVSDNFETSGERGKNKPPTKRNSIRVSPSNTLSTRTVANPVAEEIFSRVAK